MFGAKTLKQKYSVLTLLPCNTNFRACTYFTISRFITVQHQNWGLSLNKFHLPCKKLKPVNHVLRPHASELFILWLNNFKSSFLSTDEDPGKVARIGTV